MKGAPVPSLSRVGFPHSREGAGGRARARGAREKEKAPVAPSLSVAADGPVVKKLSWRVWASASASPLGWRDWPCILVFVPM